MAMSARVDFREEIEGYLLVIFIDDSHYCGYVGIPKDHILGELCYGADTFPSLQVHGGVTYSGKLKEELNPQGLHCIGFDCAHWGDKTRYSDGEFRDLSYARDEVISLFKQLKSVFKKERTSFYFEVSEMEKE